MDEKGDFPADDRISPRRWVVGKIGRGEKRKLRSREKWRSSSGAGSEKVGGNVKTGDGEKNLGKGTGLKGDCRPRQGRKLERGRGSCGLCRREIGEVRRRGFQEKTGKRENGKLGQQERMRSGGGSWRSGGGYGWR